jgi:8-oxo-dGTP pyrophosphatase MutT (NUDIX family)
MRTSAMDRLWRLGLWVAYRVMSVGWYVFRPQRRGVFIAVWHNRELLVIRNSYRQWYALPAGGVRRGETPAQAAVRELREEVGIAAAPEALHFAGDISTTFEFKRDRCSFFEVEFDARPDFCVDGREVIWADFLTLSAALEMRLAPPVREYLNDRLVKLTTKGLALPRLAADRS